MLQDDTLLIQFLSDSMVGSIAHGVKQRCNRKRKLVQSPFQPIDAKKKTNKQSDLEVEPIVEKKKLEIIRV